MPEPAGAELRPVIAWRHAGLLLKHTTHVGIGGKTALFGDERNGIVGSGEQKTGFVDPDLANSVHHRESECLPELPFQ